MNSALSRSLLHLALYALSALIVATIFHSDMFRRMASSHPEKIGMPLLGPRTDLGDNYVYYTYAKNGLAACGTGLTGSPSDGAASNTIACTYPGGLIVSHFLYKIAKTFSPSPRWEPALTLLLHTALLAFALLTCASSILHRHFGPGLAVTLSGTLMFVLGNFALSFYLGFPYKYFDALYAAEPDILRIMNPTTFWALGLFTLGFLIETIRNPSKGRWVGFAIFAGLLGTASISVSLTFFAGACLFLIIEWISTRRFCMPALLCAGILFLGIAGMLWMFKIYWASDTGNAFKHGHFLGVRFKAAFLFLLPPALIGRICPNNPSVDRLLKCLLIAAMGIGMFCDSIELGGRLWLRGAAIIALICCAAWLWASMAWLLSHLPQKPAVRFANGWVDRHKYVINAVAVIAGTLILFATLAHIRPWNPDTWRGYMARDKFEALAWINRHAEKGAIVASPDIDDSYVIPYYTETIPFVPVYGLSSISLRDGVRRYFCTLSFLRNGKDYVARLLSANNGMIEAHFRFLVSPVLQPYDYQEFQKVAFYESLLYYPYNLHYKDVLQDPQLKQQFISQMQELEKIGTQCPASSFSYLLLRNDDPPKDASRFKEVFRNKSFVILQSKMQG